MYDRNLAPVYDLIYGAGVGKDYAQEAREIAALVRERRPHSASLLDVACGTGMHLLHLRELFERLEGVELSPEMAAIAESRLGPSVPVNVADMRDFDLGRRFDVVTCLFSSIGYVQSPAELHRALERFAAHLVPGGILVLEPWFTPQAWMPGTVHEGTATDEDGRIIVRVSYSGLAGEGKSSTEMHYLLGEPGVGVRHWSDRHVLSLFTEDEYLDAFVAAGFGPVERVAGWREGRDRLIAIQPKG